VFRRIYAPNNVKELRDDEFRTFYGRSRSQGLVGKAFGHDPGDLQGQLAKKKGIQKRNLLFFFFFAFFFEGGPTAQLFLFPCSADCARVMLTLILPFGVIGRVEC
jgi:hypothetical protein